MTTLQGWRERDEFIVLFQSLRSSTIAAFHGKRDRGYGFAYMGSRRNFTTRLLFAIDVSGSMGTEELRQGFSVVNRFFNYGVPAIDVIQFDTEITGDAMTFRY